MKKTTVAFTHSLVRVFLSRKRTSCDSQTLPLFDPGSIFFMDSSMKSFSKFSDTGNVFPFASGIGVGHIALANIGFLVTQEFDSNLNAFAILWTIILIFLRHCHCFLQNGQSLSRLLWWRKVMVVTKATLILQLELTWQNQTWKSSDVSMVHRSHLVVHLIVSIVQ